jgi:hypothetical protein
MVAYWGASHVTRIVSYALKHEPSLPLVRALLPVPIVALANGFLLSSPVAFAGSSIAVATVQDGRRSESACSRPNRPTLGRGNARGRGALDRRRSALAAARVRSLRPTVSDAHRGVRFSEPTRRTGVLALVAGRGRSTTCAWAFRLYSAARRSLP